MAHRTNQGGARSNANDAVGDCAVTAPMQASPRTGRVFKSLGRKMMAGLVALSVGAMGLPAISTAPAQADGYYGYYGSYGHAPRYRGYRHHYGPPRYYGHRAHKHRKHHRKHHRRGNDTEAAIAGAIVGLAIGAIIASEANRSNRYRSQALPPQRHHRGHTGHQVYRSAPGPQVAHQWDVAPEPFTDQWYSYCASKYRSFDPDTGTFQPYHGPRKLCR